MTVDAKAHASAATPATGMLLVVAASLLWSTGGLIVRELGPIDSWTIVFWRSLSAFAFLVVLGLAQEGAGFPRAVLRMGWPGLVIALCYTVASIGFVVASKLTTVAEVLIIMACAPLLAALLGRFVIGERLSALGWLAMLASAAGVALMVSDSFAHGSIGGDLVAMGIACAIAVATVTFRKSHEVSLVPGVCLAALFATLLALPLAHPLPLPPRELGLLAFFGAGQLGFGLAMYASGARLIPAAQAAMLGVLEPLFGPAWVWLAFGETPSPAGLVGGAVVIAALMVFTVSGLRGRASGLPISARS